MWIAEFHFQCSLICQYFRTHNFSSKIFTSNSFCWFSHTHSICVKEVLILHKHKFHTSLKQSNNIFLCMLLHMPLTPKGMLKISFKIEYKKPKNMSIYLLKHLIAHAFKLILECVLSSLKVSKKRHRHELSKIRTNKRTQKC